MKRIFVVCLLILLVAAPALAEDAVGYKRAMDVVYGRKFGMALTMDVFQPKTPNGAGIVLVVSGGWASDHDWLDSFLKPLLEVLTARNYTVFAVCHGAQPKFNVREIIADVNRGVRFIRIHASEYKVDPNRLGATGASAGGHLSLMLGAAGTQGKADAKDPVERASSVVQCVACFVPATDLLNFGGAGIDAVGVGPLQRFRPAFGLTGDSAEERHQLGKVISPIYFVTPSTAPTLIIHGEKDELVPVQQSVSYVKRLEEAKVPCQLIVREGKGHMWDLRSDLVICADWFDKYLLNGKK
jgi:acetyl esterase/lipase